MNGAKLQQAGSNFVFSPIAYISQQKFSSSIKLQCEYDYEKAVCSLIPLHEKHYIVHVKEKEKKTNYSQEPTYVFN